METSTTLTAIRMIISMCIFLFQMKICYSLMSSGSINRLSSPLNSDRLLNKLSVRERPTTLAVKLADQKLVNYRRQSQLYFDLFGLGAPEVLVCAGVFTLVYGPGRVKSQLKGNGVKGKLTAEDWTEEHNERIAEVKKYAVLSRQKRAWVKINLAIDNDDPVMLAKLAELDAKNPETIKALQASMEEDTYADDEDDDEDEEDDDNYDDEDDDDDDEDDDEEDKKLDIPLTVSKERELVV
jgi:hypothetical protein